MYALLRVGSLVAVVVLSMSAVRPERRGLERTVRYHISEDPTNPWAEERGITVTLRLAAIDSFDDTVGWEVVELRACRSGVDRLAGAVWVERFPLVESADGLWWCRHRDAKAPVLPEFAVSPMIVGVARCQEPGGADMVYAIEGVRRISLPRGARLRTAATLNYYFALSGSAEPEAEGEDEPVGVDPDISDPPLGISLVGIARAEQAAANAEGRAVRTAEPVEAEAETPEEDADAEANSNGVLIDR